MSSETLTPDFEPATERAIAYLIDGNGLSEECRGHWSCDAIRKIGQRMPSTHAYIRGKLKGGVLLAVPVSLSPKPSGYDVSHAVGEMASIMEEGKFRWNDVRDCVQREENGHYLPYDGIATPEFWTDIKLLLSAGRQQEDGSRTGKKVLKKMRKEYEIKQGATGCLKDAKMKDLQNLLSAWLESLPTDKAVTVRISTRLKGFFRLGEYRSDEGSCFAKGGCDQWDKFILAQIPNSFVATVTDDDGGRGRAWGVWDSDKFYVTNAYETNLGTSQYVMECIIKAAEILGLDTNEMNAVGATGRPDRPTGFPFYLNKDARSFTRHEEYKVTYSPTDALCLKCGDFATDWKEKGGVWCAHPDHAAPDQEECYYCQESCEGVSYEVSGETTCEDCWGSSTRCESCDEDFTDDDVTSVSNGDGGFEYMCERCEADNTATCDGCDERIVSWAFCHFRNRSRDAVCPSCFYDAEATCEGCGTDAHHEDDCEQIDHAPYCEDCCKEKEASQDE